MKYKNLIYLILIFFFTNSNFSYSASAQESDVQEYGIGIITEYKCLDIAQVLNKKIAQNLPELENIHNNWHVTLYHGAFKEADLPKIKSTLLNIKVHKIDMRFTDFNTTENRFVNWNIENTNELQTLHEKVVKAVNFYHMRPLNRARDVYHLTNNKNKKQIDKYGIYGVMEDYKPHLTLFYVYPGRSVINKIPDIIKNPQYEDVICQSQEIALGKLGYNGNLIEIIEIIEIIPMADAS